MNCDNTFVPEYKIDECNGCFVKPQCIIIQEDIPELNIVKGDTLESFISQVVEKLRGLNL